MLKLYKKINKILHYHEAWAKKEIVFVHNGKVGERGKTKEHPRDKKLTPKAQIKLLLAKPMKDGYQPIEVEDHKVLLIEYKVEDGFGNEADLDKRYELQDRMDELLGWTGLGMCDGGSVGSGTMEVCCFVVDFKIAKRVIAADLKKTAFGDYHRIFEEGTDTEESSRQLSDNSSKQPKEGQGDELLLPPWDIFPKFARNDPAWTSGHAGKYLARWQPWFQGMPTKFRKAYLKMFGVPKGWKSFMKTIG